MESDGTPKVDMSVDSQLERAVRIPTMREIVAPLFRQKRAGMLAALAAFAATSLFVLARRISTKPR
jgi:hypothetical protein